jgi:hypothetical protein
MSPIAAMKVAAVCTLTPESPSSQLISQNGVPIRISRRDNGLP